MKRRVVSVCLALAMTVGLLAGCGNSDSKNTKKEETSKSSTDEKITLNFWCHQNEAWVVSYKKMAEKFNASQDK